MSYCRFFVTVLFIVVLPKVLWAQVDESVALTIYSKSSPGAIAPVLYRPVPGMNNNKGGGSIPGYAIVRHKRPLMFNQLANNISFTDVAAWIDPTTVMFKSLTHPQNTHVVEQDYKFDLVSQHELLKRFLGKEIEVEQALGDKVRVHKGTLLSVMGMGLVIQDKNNKLITLNSYDNIIFPELPDEFVVKPTLSWLVSTTKKGKHDVEVSYKTSALTWWSDYNLVYREDDSGTNKGYVDISAWVSIINQSGLSYNQAKLKIVAGDVQTASPRRDQIMELDAAPAMARSYSANKFQQKAFFEYHLYSLENPTTLPNNATKQLELFSPVYNVPVEKTFIYDHRKGNKVAVFIAFLNEERHDLGIPFPAGRVRVSKRDEADGNLEFIGESVIDHTPKDEKVNVKLGNAFDVVTKRVIKHSSNDRNNRRSSQTVEVTLKNRKDDRIKIQVIEPLTGHKNWVISNNSHTYKKKTAHEVEFFVSLNPGQERKLYYTVDYRW